MLPTRPDLSYAVRAVSQFSSVPSVDHFAALLHIFRFSRGSAHLQLHFMRCSAFEVIPKASYSTSPITEPHYTKIAWNTGITGHDDRDWAGCLDLLNNSAV